MSLSRSEVLIIELMRSVGRMRALVLHVPKTSDQMVRELKAMGRDLTILQQTHAREQAERLGQHR